MTVRRAAPSALAGLVALGLGLGAAELVAGILGRPSASPITAAGGWFIDVVPGWLAELAISWFGTADKFALGVGIAVVLVLAGAVAGVLTAWHRVVGIAFAAALVVLAALVVWSRPESGAADIVPMVVAGVLALPVLAWLSTRAAAVIDSERPAVADSAAHPAVADSTAGPAVADPAAGPPRRAFLGVAAGVAGVAALAGAAGRWLVGGAARVDQARAEVAVDLDIADAEPPRGADLEVPDAEPWQTPNDDFYRIDTAFLPPSVSPDGWRLRVHGIVEREVELDYDELLAMGLVDRWITLTCVSNTIGGSLVGNALWTGVPIADVLALAEPSPDADAVLSTSHDGWTCGTPLSALTDGRDSLLAVGMNAEPLPVDHGFPVRMVVPGLYGYVSATKWVVDLEVTRFDRFEAYWTTRGWAEQAPIKVASRIEVPDDGARVAAGTVAVAGTAWAQFRGIEAVEVRVDQGPWRPAELGEMPSDDTWRQWLFRWDAPPGEHSLEVRATTADGEVQTGERAQPVPDGATGWHRVTVTVT